LKFLSGSLLELLGRPRTKSTQINNLIKTYEDEDEVTKAVSFLPEVAFPKLWDALWRMKWSHEKKVAIWSRFLTQFGTIARASDVTGSYCPKFSTCSTPTNPDDWTEDGMPSWIELTWTCWKARPANQKREPYLIRLHHNPKHLQYCPVHWLIAHWTLRDDDLDNANAPMFTRLGSIQYQKALSDLFKEAGQHCEACSSHSVRRSAAQWAGRCGADVCTIKNIGRWICLTHLLKYVSEGVQVHLIMMSDFRGADPIFEFYPFNVKTAVSAIEATASELRAMQAR
jgi:hypothetical protein